MTEDSIDSEPSLTDFDAAALEQARVETARDLARRARTEPDLSALENRLLDAALGWLQRDLTGRGLMLDLDRLKAFPLSGLPGLQVELHRIASEAGTAGDEAEAAERFEGLLLRMFDEFMDELVDAPLSDTERRALETIVDRDAQAFLAIHGDRLVENVRRHLRSRARRAGATPSQVAQSVWESFLRNHRKKVDLNDPDSTWALLIAIARRHERKWDQRGKARRTVSLDAPAGNDSNGDGSHLGAELTGSRVDDPIAAFVVREILILAGVETPTLAEVGLQMISPLTARQRDVMALHLAGQSRAEIAATLGISVSQVDRALAEARDILRTRLMKD